MELTRSRLPAALFACLLAAALNATENVHFALEARSETGSHHSAVLPQTKTNKQKSNDPVEEELVQGG